MEHYILMADIIDSGAKNNPRLMSDFKNLVSQANKVYKKSIISPLTITLGDEFQGLVSDLPSAIALLLYLDEQLIRNTFDFKLRYVLLLGNIETEINRKMAHGMLGSGLTRARQKLSELKTGNGRYHIRVNSRYENCMLNNLFWVYQEFMDDWKAKDLHIVKAFLELEDYKQVAKSIKIDSSSAWRREKSLKIRAYHTIKDTILTFVSYEHDSSFTF